MNLLSGLAEWMCKPETGTLSGFRIYSDLSSELCDDTLADRKTETGAGNKIIEFDKTVEYSRLLFRFDSYTRILYGEFRLCSLLRSLIILGKAYFYRW